MTKRLAIKLLNPNLDDSSNINFTRLTIYNNNIKKTIYNINMKAKSILIIVDHLKHYLFKVDKYQNSFVNILIKFKIPKSDIDHEFQILNHENFKLHIPLYILNEKSL